MAATASLLWCLSFSVAIVLWFVSKKGSSKSGSRPPGPPGWPLIGNILDAGSMPHQNFYKLRAKYGPVLWLKLGLSNTLVIQSAKAAEQLFKKHDLAFSDRRVFDSMKACEYSKGSLAHARYGEYWRTVRKLCSSELFSQKRMTDSAAVREKCAQLMIDWIREDANGSGTGEVELERYLILMTYNLVGNFLISRDIVDAKSEKRFEFVEAMNKFMEWNGKPNLVDVFPFLKWLDPQGIRRNTEVHLGELIRIVQEFVKERVEEKRKGENRSERDFLDSLLEFEGDGKGVQNRLSQKTVAIVVLEMFFGGIETTTTSIHWAMAELLHNPNSFKKLKEEIDQVLGSSRDVQESDLSKLPFLQAVVKETMRLHPPLPLLLPRNVMEDTEYMGYSIPKDTMVLLNAWAIHRDPDSWDDPLSFKPERFVDSEVDPKGQHFGLIPFGSGRRICIGMMLGEKMVGLTLASLVKAFDWKLPGNVTPETMDMRELTGISLRKLVPLTVIPVERY